MQFIGEERDLSILQAHSEVFSDLFFLKKLIIIIIIIEFFSSY